MSRFIGSDKEGIQTYMHFNILAGVPTRAPTGISATLITLLKAALLSTWDFRYARSQHRLPRFLVLTAQPPNVLTVHIHSGSIPFGATECKLSLYIQSTICYKKVRCTN
jgi:hypothetical protein